jgi:dienelactone hydrolase
MLAVDYRPAPEAPAGAAASDGLAAVTWLRERADNLGVDPARIAVMGDSAGGGVAASVAILARDHRIPFARQLLVYPMLDPHHRTRPPSRGGAHPLLLRLQPHGVGRRPPRARRDASSGAKHRPARNTNFAGLAPSYIEVGEMDIFRDEDVGYARQLWRAGVSTELHVHPGMPHAFDVLLLGNDLRYQADKNPRHPPRVRPQSRGSTSSAHWAGLARRATPARLPRAVGSDGRLPRLGTNVQRPVPEVYRTDIVSALSRPGRGGRCRRACAGHSGRALACQRRDARGLLPARPGPPQCSFCTDWHPRRIRAPAQEAEDLRADFSQHHSLADAQATPSAAAAEMRAPQGGRNSMSSTIRRYAQPVPAHLPLHMFTWS